MKSTQKRYINNELARSIGNNIQTARLDADGKSRGNLTQKELAEMANQQDKELRLNTRRIGDIERGYRIVNLRELVAISAALGKSVHEMITGDRPEFYQLTKKYGLTQKAAQTLEDLYKDKKYAINAIKVLLEDKDMTEVLAEALLLYAETTMLAISPLTEKTVDNFIYVDSQMGDEMMKQVAMHKLMQLLDFFRKKWDKRYYSSADLKYKRLERKRKQKSADAETMERLLRKLKERVQKDSCNSDQNTRTILDMAKECDTLLSEIENKLLDDARKEKETFRIKLLRKIMNPTGINSGH